jgi:hypothetical protein
MMIGFSRRPTTLDIDDTVELLVTDPRKRPASFPFEREIRLFQFKTWIYFPESEMVRMAGRIVGTLYLMRLAHGIPVSSLRSVPEKIISTADYQRLFKDANYQSLFDEVIGAYGGWECLLDTKAPGDFDEELESRFTTSETVCQMIGYRYRYLAHGETNSQEANISHSEFYRWKDPTNKLSWKTIRSRWQANKQSAVFLFTSENYDFRPPPVLMMGFLACLSEEAADRKRILKFFGYSAYVQDTLNDAKPGSSNVRIPDSVKRIRLPTKPLSDEERNRMLNYASEKHKMKES